MNNACVWKQNITTLEAWTMKESSEEWDSADAYLSVCVKS